MTSSSRVRWLAVLMIAAGVVVPVIFAAQLSRASLVPHHVVLGIAGPVVVSQAVGRQAAGAGDGFEVTVLDDSDRPAREVGDGRLDAAVVLDLRGTVDDLLVPRTASSTWTSAVLAQTAAVSAGYGRTLVVREVATRRGDDVRRGTPYVLVVVWVGLGAALAIGLSLWRGPVASTSERGALRLLGLAGAGLVGSTVVAVVAHVLDGTPLVGPLVLGACLTTVVAWSVLACEALLGLLGLGFSMAALVGLTAPLLSRLEADVLPGPWRQELSWTPHGATLRLLHSELFWGRGTDLRAAAVLAAWAVIAVLVPVVARALRPA